MGAGCSSSRSVSVEKTLKVVNKKEQEAIQKLGTSVSTSKGNVGRIRPTKIKQSSDEDEDL